MDVVTNAVCSEKMDQFSKISSIFFVLCCLGNMALATPDVLLRFSLTTGKQWSLLTMHANAQYGLRQGLS